MIRSVALFVAVFMACGPQQPPQPPPLPDVADLDGGILGSLPEQACARLNQLRCPEALDARGVPCVDRMARYVASPYLGIDAECIVRAANVAMLPRCGVQCR